MGTERDFHCFSNLHRKMTSVAEKSHIEAKNAFETKESVFGIKLQSL